MVATRTLAPHVRRLRADAPLTCSTRGRTRGCQFRSGGEGRLMRHSTRAAGERLYCAIVLHCPCSCHPAQAVQLPCAAPLHEPLHSAEADRLCHLHTHQHHCLRGRKHCDKLLTQVSFFSSPPERDHTKVRSQKKQKGGEVCLLKEHRHWPLENQARGSRLGSL